MTKWDEKSEEPGYRTVQWMRDHLAASKRRWQQECRDLEQTDPAKYERIQRTKRDLVGESLCPECYGAPYDGCPVCHGDGWNPDSTAEARMAAFAAAAVTVPIVKGVQHDAEAEKLEAVA